MVQTRLNYYILFIHYQDFIEKHIEFYGRKWYNIVKIVNSIHNLQSIIIVDWA